MVYKSKINNLIMEKNYNKNEKQYKNKNAAVITLYKKKLLSK